MHEWIATHHQILLSILFDWIVLAEQFTSWIHLIWIHQHGLYFGAFFTYISRLCLFIAWSINWHLYISQTKVGNMHIEVKNNNLEHAAVMIVSSHYPVKLSSSGLCSYTVKCAHVAMNDILFFHWVSCCSS